MATTNRQRKGAKQLGTLAGLTGGPGDRSDEEFRALLGPLSVVDVERIRTIYRTGVEIGRREIRAKTAGSDARHGLEEDSAGQ